ncbi:alginate O-acetyltransferase AlgF [Sulfitobacter mediterraneus]|uniref:Alginate biosynthesis protein AlgF n=1 Tax=Sulfitobacter mediterraneus TaxID=83219 RepID=A0A061SWZ0_9RHOB|nr:alginate O-acetyltransferase AlgF [Sulfitobacter mediterraneus]KAJ04628.1 hypothetical protein PM02_02170 [Sulfitobacter mediterraneus]UWR11538.1 alginate O-acetyltransferase AlgF [Sulfitobacter mediterraneus]
MITFNAKALTIAAALVAGTPAMAQDNSLYAEAAPDDAAFVRFVGFQDADSAVFAGRSFDLSDTASGAYIPVSSAEMTNVAAGEFQTVLRKADGTIVSIAEAARDRQTKVFLFLINATEQPLDLRLADNSATVIKSVGFGASNQRSVNPVSVSLGVFPEGSDAALGTFDVELRRGQNLSFVATDQGVALIEHSFGSVAK